MRYIGLSTLISFILISCVESRSKEIKNRLMDDPLIGISYDPNLVMFDPCPRALDTREAAAQGHQWIFAECAQPLDTLYIVSCFRRLWNDRDGEWVDSILEPDFGAIIKVRGGENKAIGTPDGLYGKHAILSTQSADCLMVDAATRYVKAFGGPAELQRVLSKNGVTNKNLPSAFVEALKIQGVTLGIESP